MTDLDLLCRSTIQLREVLELLRVGKVEEVRRRLVGVVRCLSHHTLELAKARERGEGALLCTETSYWIACQRCHAAGPRSPHIWEAHLFVERAGWRAFQGGWYCPACRSLCGRNGKQVLVGVSNFE